MPGVLCPLDLKSAKHATFGEQLEIIHLTGPRIAEIDALQRRLVQMPEREHRSPAILRDDPEFIRPSSRCRRLTAMSFRHFAYRSSCRALLCATHLCESTAEHSLQCFARHKRCSSSKNERCMVTSPNRCLLAFVSRAERSPESAHGFLRWSKMARLK